MLLYYLDLAGVAVFAATGALSASRKQLDIIGFLFLAEAEGRGYAREAAEAARGFAFGRLGWTSVVSYVDPDNVRSVRLAGRLGARRDAATVDGALVFRHVAPEAGA